MPIYMDRHDVSEAVTAEIVAKIHQEDLKIQEEYKCRALTYWFDDARKMAFCLIEAPDRKAIIQMHDHAHGEVPHQIIEVDTSLVESFLGRIKDPDKAQNTNLNIIDDAAFRTIMVISIEHHTFSGPEIESILLSTTRIQKRVRTIIQQYGGNIVQQREEGTVVSYRKVSDAILCALEIQEHYMTNVIRQQVTETALHIGLHAGVPVTESASIFEETLKLAYRMCFITRSKVNISTEVMQLYVSENSGEHLRANRVGVVSPAEATFISRFMEFIEKQWQNSNLRIEDIEKDIGISKSKLYREMIRLTGKSPNAFLLYYRLSKALQMLQTRKGNISEVAFDAGFSSPSYFAKCFRTKFGIIPSELLLHQT